MFIFIYRFQNISVKMKYNIDSVVRYLAVIKSCTHTFTYRITIYTGFDKFIERGSVNVVVAQASRIYESL